MIKKPCPFCQNPNASEYDAGDACCFCDYEGVITIGLDGMFTTLKQYNEIYYTANHKERMDNLHGRNDKTLINIML